MRLVSYGSGNQCVGSIRDLLDLKKKLPFSFLNLEAIFSLKALNGPEIFTRKIRGKFAWFIFYLILKITKILHYSIGAQRIRNVCQVFRDYCEANDPQGYDINFNCLCI